MSVIVPVYNAEFFIKDCLDSILAQDFSGLEILVSDDGSTDKTRLLLEEYKNNERIVIFLQSENLGITENCNFLLNKASGKYICFFAGDDIMLPDKINKQYLYMEANEDLSFSYHLVDVFDSETGKTLAIANQSLDLKGLDAGSIICQMGIPASMSIMTRKSMLPEGYFNNDFYYVSDWLMQVELAINGRVGCLNEVLCRYRKYSDNNGKDISLYEEEFLKLLDHLNEKYPFLSDFCLKGKARYFFGKAFRVNEIAEREIALKKSIDNKFSILCLFFLIAIKLPFSDRLFNFLYKKRFFLRSKI